MTSSRDQLQNLNVDANYAVTHNGLVEPLVSIIIPNYNHGAYLADAIQSALDQTYSNIEIIVVDDGSTDDSQAVANKFREQIHYMYQRNGGLCAARNTGLRAAKGTYIGLLDADDMLEPDYCRQLVSALLAFPDAEGIICGYRFVDVKNNSLPQVESRCLAGENLYEILLGGNFLVPESVLLHRRCYKSAGPFDTALTACEDWDMWLRVSKSHKIICTERVLTRHRILPASMSSDPLRMLNNRLAVLHKHVGQEPRGDGAVHLKRYTYGHVYFRTALEYELEGDSDAALRCLTKAISIYPELMTDVRTFYEVGCSKQPKGSRGYLPQLDIRQSEDSIRTIMDNLILGPDVSAKIAQQQRKICSVAFWALSLLAYGSGNLPEARRFMWHVAINEPSSLIRRDYMGLLGRVMLGEAGLSRTKRLAKWFSIILPRGGRR